MPRYHDEKLIETAREYYKDNVAAGRTGKNWLRILIAFGVETHDTLKPFSAAEARERVSRWSGWKPFAKALEEIESEEDAAGDLQYHAVELSNEEVAAYSEQYAEKYSNTPEEEDAEQAFFNAFEPLLANSESSEGNSDDLPGRPAEELFVELDDFQKKFSQLLELKLRGEPLRDGVIQGISNRLEDVNFPWDEFINSLEFLNSLSESDYDKIPERAVYESFAYSGEYANGVEYIKSFLIDEPVPEMEKQFDQLDHFRLRGEPLSDHLIEEVEHRMQSEDFLWDEFIETLEFLNGLSDEDYQQLPHGLPHDALLYFNPDDDKENGIYLLKSFLPIEAPAPDINFFKCWVHENPLPDRTDTESYPVLKVLEQWMVHLDKNGDEIAFGHRNHHYSIPSDDYPTDQGGSPVQLEWRYVTDSGEDIILEQYPIGYNWRGALPFIDYYIRAEPGNLYVRYKNFQTVHWNSDSKVMGPWSEPKRITHGFQTHDQPHLPTSPFTEPYIAIERYA